MARQKNALRGHFIAPVTDPKTEPAKEAYKELAKWIEDVDDDTDEATTSVAYYDGDGTEETTVTSVKDHTHSKVPTTKKMKQWLLSLV